MSFIKTDWSFYPTPFKGCAGIVFHPWCPDGRAGEWREKVYAGFISETRSCMMLVLGGDFGGVAVQHLGVTLI